MASNAVTAQSLLVELIKEQLTITPTGGLTKKESKAYVPVHADLVSSYVCGNHKYTLHVNIGC